MTRPRVLLVAEECNPRWVSVPLVGWSHASALREVADIHLVTQIRNREALIEAGLVESEDFTAIDSEPVARPLWRIATLLRGGSGGGWTTATAVKSIAYYAFEHLLWRRFGDDLRRGRFDLVHRLTPLSPAIAGLLPSRCGRIGVPFVVGPLNGGVPWPAGFDRERRREREWLSSLRRCAELMPGAAALRRKASAVIVGGVHTHRELSPHCPERCVYMPENGIDAARFAAPPSVAFSPPLRLVFVGRLVPLKGVDMLLKAAAPLLAGGRAVLEIIGDGPQRDALAALAAELDIAERVRIRGWIDHADLPAALASNHVLVLPSIREFGGGVVLEAMALGLVPVVIDYGGPPELIASDCGFAIPMGSREMIIDGLRNRLTAIADDPAMLQPMGAAARRRVERYFTWTAKARQVRGVYDWVLGCGPRPDPGMPFHAAIDGDDASSRLAA